MQAPTRADYVRAYFTLFARFEQEREKGIHYGHPFEYAECFPSKAIGQIG